MACPGPETHKTATRDSLPTSLSYIKMQVSLFLLFSAMFFPPWETALLRRQPGRVWVGSENRGCSSSGTGPNPAPM
eukprot:894113-Pelagomonas_calceolata.AAC.5